MTKMTSANTIESAEWATRHYMIVIFIFMQECLKVPAGRLSALPPSSSHLYNHYATCLQKRASSQLLVIGYRAIVFLPFSKTYFVNLIHMKCWAPIEIIDHGYRIN